MAYKEETIKELADSIDCGFVCFLHKETGEIESYMEDVDLFLEEEDPWEDVIDKVDNNREDYIKIEKMDSNQAFRVMERFADRVDSEKFREKLINALNRGKPFRNFKYQIDDSDYRQDWFDFKLQENMQWVKEQIEASEL